MSSITEHCLAPSLRERLRAGQGERLPAPRAGHAHVLYLLRTAFRADNNPSLEIALRMASSLGLPLVCLAVIEDGTPRDRMWPPTDRAVAFRLEALRELQPLFAARGTALYVHVERDGHRQAAAMSLSAKAALVICDEHFGIEPHATAAARAAQACGGALWLCDTACTVASTTLTASALVGGNGGFLRATAAARAMRLGSDGSWFHRPRPLHHSRRLHSHQAGPSICSRTARWTPCWPRPAVEMGPWAGCGTHAAVRRRRRHGGPLMCAEAGCARMPAIATTL